MSAIVGNDRLFKTSQQKLLLGLEKSGADFNLAALTRKKDRYLYDYVQNSKEIEWEYHPTVLSAKKFFFPAKEVILEYSADGSKVAAKIESQPTVLFGVRPCEVNAIKILDEAFAESNGDPNYLAKRENSLVIAMDCKTVCDQSAFCYKVGSQHAEQGCDLMLHEHQGEYLLRVITEKGESFAAQYLDREKASRNDYDSFVQEKEHGFQDLAPFTALENLPEIFEENKDHHIWKDEAERCLSCGSCILVCPTCYCFDVADELALNVQEGQRIRRWDACMLHSFADTATGENFRESPVSRLKHRILRKFDYLMKKHGQSVCVGCGRCVRACLAEISPKTIVQAITHEEE